MHVGRGLLRPLAAWRAYTARVDAEARAAGLVVTVLPRGGRSYRHPMFDDPAWQERQRFARLTSDRQVAAARPAPASRHVGAAAWPAAAPR